MQQIWGGNLDFEYQHEKYWQHLIRFTDERKRRWKERWKELGSLVGTREWRYKQGEEIQERNVDEPVNTPMGISNVPGALSVSVDCGSDDSRKHYPKLQSPGWVVIEDNTEHPDSNHHSHRNSFWQSLWGHHTSSADDDDFN
jgi:hypothetical protein